jgi:hypothetical protein
MPTLADPAVRAELRRRLDGLRPEATPAWGNFSAPQMLAHITDTLRMAMGELPVEARLAPVWVRTAPMKQLLLYVLPFPKNLPTAPALVARGQQIPASNWAAERAAFDAALERIGNRAPDGPWPTHPFFGPLSARAWKIFQYRHCDHHCRQFGI